MHSYERHAASLPSLFSHTHSLTPQLTQPPTRPIPLSHRYISAGTAKPASYRKPCSRETIIPPRRCISAFPRCTVCTVTDSSCIAQRTNAATVGCDVPKAVHELHRLLAHVPARLNRKRRKRHKPESSMNGKSFLNRVRCVCSALAAVHPALLGA